MPTSEDRVSREILRSPSKALLALQMSGWLLVLPLAKRIFPVEDLAKFVWRDGRARRMPEQDTFMVRLARRLTRFSGSNCLERSLLIYRFLGRNGANPTLVLGMGRGTERGVIGHAWIVVDGLPLIDSEDELEPYEPFVAFGPGARRIAEPAATSSTAA
jgi:hypothetical protein